MNKIKTIYCITNKINNKKYIGSTIINPQIRFKQHVYNANHENTHQHNYPLYLAFRKYGLDNFNFEILFQDNCSEEEIRLKEQEYIILLNTLSPNGYNQTIDTLHPINDINTYKKISETKREKAKEVVELDEFNNIINKWRSIVDCAECLKINEKKIAACCRGERKTTSGKNFKWIDENNNIIFPVYDRNSYKGEKGTTQYQSTNKRVNKIDKENNNIIQIYDTIALAARENNCDASAISKVCNGKRKTCGGFKWTYVE